ncbi:MAG: ABC transporter ATP-binding protein [Halofilum sp. (in: g-proteobacteria)]|nr:ABC transporter ATP-binding protein [Halofilum sp. (in: g-proteobacteria)]
MHRRVGGRLLLDGVDCRVQPGQTVALVGVNGAGKSTLIKGMLDLQAIDAGHIEIDGVAHTDRRARESLAYLPERFQPPYFLRGTQYLDYMSRLYRNPHPRAEMVAQAGQLGLTAAELERPAQTYSKGMAQMLGLAACLLSGRHLLVLDEPMSGLDPTARVRLQRALRDARAVGRTIFFTTHLMQDAEALADRVLVLHEGHIIADESPADLAARHGGDLEAAFVHLVGQDSIAHEAATG